MIKKLIGWFMRFFVKLYFKVDKECWRYFVSSKNVGTEYFLIERKG